MKNDQSNEPEQGLPISEDIEGPEASHLGRLLRETVRTLRTKHGLETQEVWDAATRRHPKGSVPSYGSAMNTLTRAQSHPPGRKFLTRLARLVCTDREGRFAPWLAQSLFASAGHLWMKSPFLLSEQYRDGDLVVVNLPYLLFAELDDRSVSNDSYFNPKKMSDNLVRAAGRGVRFVFLQHHLRNQFAAGRGALVAASDRLNREVPQDWNTRIQFISVHPERGSIMPCVLVRRAGHDHVMQPLYMGDEGEHARRPSYFVALHGPNREALRDLILPVVQMTEHDQEVEGFERLSPITPD